MTKRKYDGPVVVTVETAIVPAEYELVQVADEPWIEDGIDEEGLEERIHKAILKLQAKVND